MDWAGVVMGEIFADRDFKLSSKGIRVVEKFYLTQRDFDAFKAAIPEPWLPKPSLEEALERVRTMVRRV